ncbi:potassium-transporting ATPase subunit KdpA [Streptomyces sp. LE64]|uniref:potassium-transporting ATPase subunit KdpA n=1 Tax=Streptomyces sp. LE64 TaxID=3448653 RepID=UPI004041AD25
MFIGGLRVGRTPEYLGKRLGHHEIRSVALYLLVAPGTVLLCCALSLVLGHGASSMGNAGPHGLTELIYAYASSAAGNGSAMAGFDGTTDFHQVLMSGAMLVGRYLPMVFVLFPAGRLARGRTVAPSAGTLRTSGAVFVSLTTAVALSLALLNYLPALSLGPVAEGLG